MVAGSIIFWTLNINCKSGKIVFHKRDSIHMPFSETVPNKMDCFVRFRSCCFQITLQHLFQAGGVVQGIE